MTLTQAINALTPSITAPISDADLHVIIDNFTVDPLRRAILFTMLRSRYA